MQVLKSLVGNATQGSMQLTLLDREEAFAQGRKPAPRPQRRNLYRCGCGSSRRQNARTILVRMHRLLILHCLALFSCGRYGCRGQIWGPNLGIAWQFGCSGQFGYFRLVQVKRNNPICRRPFLPRRKILFHRTRAASIENRPPIVTERVPCAPQRSHSVISCALRLIPILSSEVSYQ